MTVRLVSTVGLLLALLATPAAAARRADLVVPKGSVGVDGQRITGSFVVRNAGRRRAKPTDAALLIAAGGKRTLLATVHVARLRGGHTRSLAVDAAVPGGLAPGSYPLLICADEPGALRERSDENNCRRVGRILIPAGSTPTPAPTQAPGTASSVPTKPVPFQPDTVFTLDSPQSNYWIDVPAAYDASHQTPMTLLVWLHGCGGQSQYDVSNVSPGGAQDWISIAVGGRENDCWDPNSDTAKVLAAIADVKTHFNVDPHRMIIGGYSSGGDLAYRTAFYNSTMFAGLLAENTSPFRDTGSSQQDSLAAATSKFNVVHLAHTGDDTYPIAGVRSETDAMKAAGFPITRVERAGTHYDDDTATTGTDHDVRTILLPHIDDGWRSP